MKRILPLLIAFCCLFHKTAFAQSVFILYEKDVPQVEYAAGKLTGALIERQYSMTDVQTDSDFLVSLAVNQDQRGAEAFSIIPDGKAITIYGGDKRGLIYGALALAEHLRNGILLENIKREDGKPNLEFRGIKFNLPWDTYRPSSA